MDQHVDLQQEIEQFIREFQSRLYMVHQKIQDLPEQIKQTNRESSWCNNCANNQNVYDFQSTPTYHDDLEKILDQFMQTTINHQQNTNAALTKIEEEINNLTKTYLVKSEFCESVTTRSGKIVGGVEKKNERLDEKNKKEENEKETSEVRKEEKQNSLLQKKIPYLIAPLKAKKEEQFTRFMEIFKTLQINIPFAEVLEQMPIYSKFMKELLSKKWRYQEKEVFSLNATCSAILQTDIPHKSKDPGSVTIPVTIGNVSVGKALVDLGASVSLMPLSMMKRIGGIQLKPTRFSLQLGDRSIKYPEGVEEDVLVKVEKFLIPVDFAIIDITEDTEIPLILGRPFTKTAKMGIDMENGKFLVQVADDEIKFDIFHVMHHPKDKGQCLQLDVIEEICAEHPRPDKSSEIRENKVEEEIIRHFSNELFLHQNPNGLAEKESELELKELPSQLKYVFLKGEATIQISLIVSCPNWKKKNLYKS
ncbi:PREDICTED: uncharacterized protein LOC109353980 [Lupinus angustifolius]|uniref:uncharacterized protein LOC109353980 n=1 Tax=Lupinus angustifolius TaxID=3871 RepID=UPI00092E5E6D|nr:PREDICTED: uncharacterized protein LOC109353980 [Lupinus angustifolius]